LKPIAYIESCYPDKFGTPRQPGLVQKAWAKIKFNSEIQPELALQGLEGFSHIWIIFEFHKNETSRYHAKVHPPRLDGKPMGVFATRSPHRPNPIGLSLVEIIRIENDSITVAGADLITGTPVLDIKPYMPEIESKPFAKSGWTCGVPEKSISVEWPDDQLAKLEKWSMRINQPDLREVVEETLKLDPRPKVYKGFEQNESPYRDKHAVRFFDGDVHFKFVSSDVIQILEVIV
jgi:tRNA-Thr(GGU) m(6)t(6)A37 methyltransferase TsaA